MPSPLFEAAGQYARVKLYQSARENPVGGIQFVIGTILSAVGLHAVGVPLMISGILQTVAGAIFRPHTSEADTRANSPTYGFQQWTNPVKGDSAIPIVLSSAGHRVAPIYVQAWITPEGEQEDDYSKVLRADGQAMSALMAVAEGPIVGIEDVRVNDEPIVERFTVRFTGNGSKTRFDVGKTRVMLETLEVTVDGTSKGWTLTDTTFRIVYDGRRLTKLTMPDAFAPEFSPVVRVNGTEVDETSATGKRPHLWLENARTLWVDVQAGITFGDVIEVDVKTRTMTGLTVSQPEGETRLNFTTAPSSGAAIVVTGLRRVFAGIRVEWRNGGTHQLPLEGFESIRNSYGVSQEIGVVGSEVTYDTTDEVDDIALLVVSSVAGFVQFDEEGKRHATVAQFKIEYEGADENGAFSGNFTQLPDPAGSYDNKFGRKNADEFEVRGDSLSQLTWAFSLRGLLRRQLEKHPNVDGVKQRLADFYKRRYRLRLTRTRVAKSATNTQFVDQITLGAVTEVVDQRLNYPGTALLAIHALASSRLQGSAPSITARVQGSRDVYQHDGTSWSTSATAQSNPVWGAIHVITNARAGGGEQFTLANIDTTSARAAADYCDAEVELPDGSAETRALLDVVIDTRRNLLAVVVDLLRPAGIWPVLQGNTWKFVIDQAATLEDVPILYDDSSDNRTADGSLGLDHDPVSATFTEVQVAFLDAAQDFDRKEVWITPGEPASNRRIQRVEAFGVVRRTEATRYGNRVYTQGTANGMPLRMALSPSALHFEAGDVVRVVSTRKGVDGYWRVLSLRFSTADYFVQVEAIPYVLAWYGQSALPLPTRHVAVVDARFTPFAPTRAARAAEIGQPASGEYARTRGTKLAARARRLA